MDVAVTDGGTRKSRRRKGTDDPAAVPVQTTSTLPSHDDIAKRAYELYLERGGEHGHDVDDWLRAERELAISPQSTRPFES